MSPLTKIIVVNSMSCIFQIQKVDFERVAFS